EVEVGEERANRRGHRRGEEDDGGDEEDERQEIAQEPEGEERRGPLGLGDGAEEAVEEREVAVEKRGADRGGHRELHDGRRVERTQLRGQEAEGPHRRVIPSAARNPLVARAATPSSS